MKDELKQDLCIRLDELMKKVDWKQEDHEEVMERIAEIKNHILND